MSGTHDVRKSHCLVNRHDQRTVPLRTCPKVSRQLCLMLSPSSFQNSGKLSHKMPISAGVGYCTARKLTLFREYIDAGESGAKEVPRDNQNCWSMRVELQCGLGDGLKTKHSRTMASIPYTDRRKHASESATRSRPCCASRLGMRQHILAFPESAQF
jgi:hypothetical protein